jgi:hypothetical protein
MLFAMLHCIPLQHNAINVSSQRESDPQMMLKEPIVPFGPLNGHILGHYMITVLFLRPRYIQRRRNLISSHQRLIQVLAISYPP